ncbi:MAG: IS21-like element helper ATPase IstB [Coriobacteriia bacterium]|nr:IS21-like element helper ATPase IstB [Coriobacteriia bacterium]
MQAKEISQELHLSYIAANIDELCKEAKATKISHKDFLLDIFEREIENRRSNRLQKRLKDAHFPFKKYLQDLDLEEYSKEIRDEIEDLMTLKFVDDKANVICIGNPGRGKTHLAIALGVAAGLADKRVLFTNVPNLVIELKEAMSKNEITYYKRKFERYELVIIDELGYVSFDKQGNEILFNLLSNRNEMGSMIITTNLVFEEWEEVFGDAKLTGALVDRLAYKAHVLDMSGDSYRLKETKEWLERQVSI